MEDRCRRCLKPFRHIGDREEGWRKRVLPAAMGLCVKCIRTVAPPSKSTEPDPNMNLAGLMFIRNATKEDMYSCPRCGCNTYRRHTLCEDCVEICRDLGELDKWL